jgi:hypothetical protein
MKRNVKKPQTEIKKLQEAPTKSFFQKVTDFFERNRKIFFILSMIAGVLMCLLLFDVKVSLSGDDSDYILYADDFWHHFTFPGFRGPLYPIVLSPFIGIFGMNLIVLKSLSAIFILLSVWFIYKSFRDIIPAIILMPALFLVCICSFVFFYASYTYSEPFFMFLQSVFIYFFSNYFLRKEDSVYDLRKDWHKYLILGAIALCMGLTRSIGYSIVGVVILYFAINKRWKDLIYTFSASILVFCLFQLFKTIVWPDAGSAYDIKNYLAKDYYNPIVIESFTGFISRFVTNSNIYLSAFLCQFMGVIPETPSNIVQTNPFLTILIYLLFFFCLFIVFKRSKALLFTGIYAGIMNFASFVILQSTWGQDRLIVVYYPLILIFLLGGIYYLFQFVTIRKFFFIYLLMILILCIGTFSITANRIGRNLPVLQENMFGNQLYGLTPDWQNFIKGSQWAAQNLDKNAVIVSRKPSISKVYTGRDFVWAPTDITVPFDSLTTLQNTDSHIVIIVENTCQSPYTQYVINAREPLPFKEKTVNGVTIINLPDTDLEAYTQSLQNQNIAYTLDYQTFFNSIQHINIRIYNPDEIRNYLNENDIRYILLAQLRVDPTRYTGLYVNNIHRFIWCISGKYPDSFRTLHVEGKDEPCEIVEFIR